MKRRINHQDIVALTSFAKDFFLRTPAGGRLPGMTRPLTPSENQALAFLDAAMSILNITDTELAVEYPDSDSIHED